MSKAGQFNFRRFIALLMFLALSVKTQCTFSATDQSSAILFRFVAVARFYVNVENIGFHSCGR